MIFKSLQAKLIYIYLSIVLMFVLFLGGTLSISYKQNLTAMRETEVVECAEQIAKMYADGQLAVVDIENGQTVPVLMTTAKDFDATIQIVNTTSRRIFYNMSESSMTIYENDELVSDEIFNVVYNEGNTYIKSNYFNEKMQTQVSTVAYPLRYANSDSDEKPWAILIINSALDSVNRAYSNIVSSLFVPIVAVFVVGLAMIIILVYGIVSRVKSLNNATQRIARGNFKDRVAIGQKDEIGQLAASFNKMAEQLAISDAKKRDFVSNAAHELRSPMTSINGFVEGMLDGTIPEEKHKDYLKIVSSEVKRLTTLIKNMLDLSRIESETSKLEIAQIDINELMRRVVIRFGQKIDEKGIIPEIELSDDPLMVYADSDKIEQVLQNLIDNAIKFTQTDKNLFLSVKAKGTKAYITIKDEGAGIAENEIDLIWDRFYTVDKAHTGHKSGTGLGLPIVKSIIEQHGQSISVTSTEGCGTEFVFTLDLVK